MIEDSSFKDLFVICLILSDVCDYDVTVEQLNFLYSDNDITLLCTYQHPKLNEVIWERKEKESDAYSIVLTAYPSSADSAATVADGFKDLVNEYKEDGSKSHKLVITDKSLYTVTSHWRCKANTQYCINQNTGQIQLQITGKYFHSDITFISFSMCIVVQQQFVYCSHQKSHCIFDVPQVRLCECYVQNALISRRIW